MVFKLLIAAGLIWSANVAQADTISLEELKRRCTEWEQNGQIKPFKSKIACASTHTSWMLSSEGGYELPRSIDFTARFSMKSGRYNTRPERHMGQIANDSGSCYNYEQYRTRVAGPVAVITSCAALNAIDDFAGYCEDLIAEQCASDPELCEESVEPTGITKTTCTGSAPGRPDPK